MAGASRTPTTHLTPLDQLHAEPWRFSLFGALRLLEQAYPARPRLGESRKASDDALRLGHAPNLSFAPSDVATCELTDTGIRLEQYSFGLYGPNGPLPARLTEHAFERRRHADDETFVDFLNIFQHRLISLFYRAWANSDPVTSFDRPDSDRFAGYVGAMLGLAPASARARDLVCDYAKLSRAGVFAQQTRSAQGLQAILTDYFDARVEIREFVGAWLPIPEESRCRLGGWHESAELGRNAFVGRASWQCQHKFEIVFGPCTLAQLNSFLPGEQALAELHALVRLYTSDEWTWQLRLLLLQEEIPRVRLGKAGRLAWSTWLGTRKGIADEVVIQEQQAPLNSW
jgi:type VI secretion system protein ImpH